MRVLIAEDEPIIGGAIADQMEALGCEVLGVVRDSASGRRLIETGHPDVLLLDVDLEDGPTGPLLADRSLCGEADVLFLTAREQVELEEGTEPRDILTKPFTPRELERWVNGVRSRRVA
ncbi:response regulator [Parvularcula maris]|uniref:Response regulator n=1 Tax=Parvularcula maris TaxID=2965077 RepID=A0A9X2L6J5_9PROT|nr:response regulator [Parvularcula maris]